MARAGGRFGGGGKKGPDFSWDDEEPTVQNIGHKPAPTFPELHLPVPKPLSHTELSSVNCYLNFRNRVRSAPFHATLDPSSLTNDKGKVAPRAGFDPFNDQDVYASKFQKKKRIHPDLTNQSFALQFFPKELWLVLDPKRRNPLWSTLDPAELEGVVGSRKRKRAAAAPLAVNNSTGDKQDDNNSSSEDSDAVITGKKKQTSAKTRRGEKNAKQRRGLDAEDDYPEHEQNGDDEEDAGEEDAPEDSEFDESEGDEGDDYNAEQYFDDGDDDGAGDDDGGGGDEGSY